MTSQFQVGVVGWWAWVAVRGGALLPWLYLGGCCAVASCSCSGNGHHLIPLEQLLSLVSLQEVIAGSVTFISKSVEMCVRGAGNGTVSLAVLLITD